MDITDCTCEAGSYFFKRVLAMPLLSEELTTALIKKAKLGDQRSRRLVVEHNLKLGIRFAKYPRSGMTFADVIQIAAIGIHLAIDSFDIDRGIKFSTYATWNIRRELTNAQRKQGDTDLLSLDEMLEGEDDSHLGLLKDERIMSEQECLDSILRREAVQTAMDGLVPSEREVLSLRFGLGSGCPLTQRDVGDIKKLNKSRIGQIEQKAYRKLRQKGSSNELLWEFVGVTAEGDYAPPKQEQNIADW